MSSSTAEVEILLATWNGERFIEQQLDSLFRQTFRNFRLSVRDDVSTDATLEILERYRSLYPSQIDIQLNRKRMGPCPTFSALAENSVAPYVAFCDQDDIWREGRLALGIAAARNIEARYGTQTPLLVFSDLTLIGQNNQIMAPSMWKLKHVNPSRATLGSMLVQNLVSGCTVLANRSLLIRSGAIPEGAVMHDFWLGLVAAAFGVLHPLYEPTVRYRQHQGNAIGAGSGWSTANVLKRINDDQSFKEGVDASRRQSETFATRYAKQLTSEQKATLHAWSHSEHLPAVVRQWTLYRNGLRRTTLLNNLVFLARV